jgi:hypothetical protein
MSDQELGKKMIEEEELYLFLDAYAIVTGDCLGCVQQSERPDFICERSDGSLVGVELTRIMRHPETVH